MQITDYEDLQAAIASYLIRDDLVSETQLFISLAEQFLNSSLRCRQMEGRATTTSIDGDRFVSLPDDFLEFNDFVVVSNGDRYPLVPITLTNLNNGYALTAGRPAYYALHGTEAIVGPIPDAEYTLELYYKRKLQPLSDSNVTNWLLADWPLLYLYGALVQANQFVRSSDNLQVYSSYVSATIEMLNKESVRAKTSGGGKRLNLVGVV